MRGYQEDWDLRERKDRYLFRVRVQTEVECQSDPDVSAWVEGWDPFRKETRVGKETRGSKRTDVLHRDSSVDRPSPSVSMPYCQIGCGMGCPVVRNSSPSPRSLCVSVWTGVLLIVDY